MDGFREATWEEALDLVAGKLKEAHVADPKSIAFGVPDNSPSWRDMPPLNFGRLDC